MGSRYVIEFSKQGYIKYTSHLDLQRLFKRAFKRTGIPIEYSRGFNPHPKMSFAQPLSLGYTAEHEYLEFTAEDRLRLDIITRELKDIMPEGITIAQIKELDIPAKSLASIVNAAVYDVILPIEYNTRHEDIEKITSDFLNQESIIAKKRDKKTKKYIDKDIRSQIRNIDILSTQDEDYSEKKIVLRMTLDSGSTSNLSPEQVISAFTEFSELYLPREQIDVERIKILFYDEFEI